MEADYDAIVLFDNEQGHLSLCYEPGDDVVTMVASPVPSGEMTEGTPFAGVILNQADVRDLHAFLTKIGLAMEAARLEGAGV